MIGGKNKNRHSYVYLSLMLPQENILPMKDLAAILENLGPQNVKTFIRTFSWYLILIPFLQGEIVI